MEPRRWSRWLPIGVSKTKHYGAFANSLTEITPTPLLITISWGALTIMPFGNDWKSNPDMPMRSETPFLYGHLNQVPVYIDPNLADNEVVVKSVDGTEVRYIIKDEEIID